MSEAVTAEEPKKKEPVKITQKIVGYKVLDKAEESKQIHDESKSKSTHELEYMHEGVKRPFRLRGSTYKIKPPGFDSALYMTVNDIVMNEGTEHEQQYPYELFLNSKKMESYQWIVTVTKTISAVFRKGGNITFIVDELEEVFDPSGGYFGRDHFKNKGKQYPSVVAEIGYILRQHMIDIGLLEPILTIKEEQDLKAKQKAKGKANPETSIQDTPDSGLDINRDTEEDEEYVLPPGMIETGVTCEKCHEPNMQLRDGCYTCVQGCGYSKCG